MFVLGIAGTAFAAANPFVDVPAKHWAYDAVAKLANAGIVDGYNDGTYRGDKNMTRYEMAQIVAKAMVKSDKADAETKALVDKLAVEFSSELQNLGVRVAKLEANQSNIKFTGDVRLRWNDDEAADDSKFYERFRINMTAAVNENTTFNGRFAMNHNEQGTTGSDDAKVAIASLTTKNVFNTGATSTIGRYAEFLGQTGYLVDTTGTGMVDGVKFTAGNALKVTAGYADFAAYNPDKAATATEAATQGVKDAVYAEAKYNTSKATNINATYFETKGIRNVDYSIIGAGFTTKFAKDWALTGDYFQNGDVAGDPEAYVARISYKGANKSVPQSWGTFVEYFNWESYATPVALTGSNMILAQTDRTAANLNEGVEGFGLGVSYTLAKNIVMEGFQTFNSEYTDSKVDTDNERTRVQVNFYF
ncbi:MAG: S-layer homology domain-containing protein [Negativicutes bacterium]|nr:S-layer homology domain-containing protein [Negativicutes bacterium]